MSKFTRRDLIHAGCTIAGASLVPHFMDRAEAGLRLHGSSAGAAPSGPGKVQVNSPLNLPSLMFPFLNYFKTMDRIWLAENNTQDGYQFLGTVVGPNITETSMPTQMPTGSSPVYQTNVYLPLLDPAASDRWVVTWDGPGTFFNVSFGISDPNITTNWIVQNPNRGEWIFTSSTYTPGTPFLTILNLSGITTGAGNQINNIKIFKKSQEALINAGVEIFAPEFVSLWKNWGTLRFMNFMGTNFSPQVKWTNRPVLSGASWWGNNILAGSYAGAVNLSNNTYTGLTALAGNPSSWTNGMTMQAVFTSLPVFSAITNITNANPASVACASHGYSNGQKIFFDPGATANGVTLNNGTNPTPPTWSSSTTYGLGAVIKGSDGFIYQSQITGNLNSNPTTYTTIPPTWLQIQNAQINTCISGFYTVTVVDANNFTIGVDSTNWGTYGTSAGGNSVPQLQAKTGSLPFKPITGLSGATPFILNGAGTPEFATNRLWSLIYDADFDALLITSAPDGNGSGSMGWPVELLCQLANKLNVNPWFCVPHMADDDYVTNLATTVKANLNTNLVAYFEYSNEVWNGLFIQFSWVTAKAKINWGNSLPGFASAVYNFYNFQYYGWRFKSIMTNIGTVFSGQMSRINRTMSEWTPQFSTALGAPTPYAKHRAQGTGLSTLHDGGNPSPAPITFADSINFAPYIEPPRGSLPTSIVWGWGYGNSAQQAAALAALDALIRATGDGNEFTLFDVINTLCPGWAGMVAFEHTQLSLNLQMIQYEGGLGFIPSAMVLTGSNPFNGQTLNTNDILNLFIGYYESSFAASAISDAFTLGNKANGGTLPSQYTLTGGWGTNGMFGAMTPNELGTVTPYVTELQALNTSL